MLSINKSKPILQRTKEEGSRKLSLSLAYFTMIMLVLGLLFYFFQLMDHTRSQAIGRLSDQAKLNAEEIEREISRLEYISETLAVLYFQKSIQQDEDTAHTQLMNNLELHMASGHFKILSASIRTPQGHLTTLRVGDHGRFDVESEMTNSKLEASEEKVHWELTGEVATLVQPLRGQKRKAGVLKLAFSSLVVMSAFKENTQQTKGGRTWWVDHTGTPAPGFFTPSSRMDEEFSKTLASMMDQLESGVIETPCPFHQNHQAYTAIAPVFIGDYDLAVLQSIDSTKITGSQIRLGIILSSMFGALLFLAMLVLKLNINQRKTALQKLADEKAVIEGMFHSIDDLIFQQDLSGNYTDCNMSFAELFGLTPMEIRGHTDAQIGIPEDQAPISKNDRQILRKARRLASEIWMEGPNGQKELVDLHKHPLQHLDGEVYGVIGIGRIKTGQWRSEQNLLELKNELEEANTNMEEALNRANDFSKEAENANKAKSEFLANMSHEIRTPLGAVIGLTDLLTQTDCSAQQLGYLNKLDNSAHSLLGIINDILDFSKIEAGKMTCEVIPFHLGEVVSQVTEMFSERVMSRNLFFIQKRGDIPELLLGDPVRVRQILVNLLGNALKFTERGGLTLTINGGTQMGDKVFLVFSVTDTGIGIAPDKLSGLFSSFSQADTSTTRQFGGTGLGLSISQQLVELMGGNIWVESEVGKGTTFHFSLPFEEMEEEAADAYMDDMYNRANQITTKPGKPLEGLSILLVDDNEINREIISEILSLRGGRVSLAEDGKQGSEKVAEENYHIVLMDMQMPVMDGPTATRIIRKEYNQEALPILALTANAQAEDKKICLDSGMNDYMSKPVDPALLVDKILALVKDQDRDEAPTAEHIAEDIAQDMAVHIAEHMAEDIVEDIDEPIVEISTNTADEDSGTPGINLTNVMKRLSHKEELFIKLVSMFVDQHGSDIDLIDQALGNKDIKQSIHLAHALKGTAGNLAAYKVQSAATDLESILRSGENIPDKSPDPLALAMQEILTTMEKLLASAAEKKPVKDDSRPPIDRDQLILSLEQLKQLVQQNDATTEDQFQSYRPDLENLVEEKLLDALSHSLLIFDFEDAQILITKLIEKLSANTV